MRNYFRDINLVTCPHCQTVLILPQFGPKAIVISNCTDCHGLVMIFKNRIYKIDKKQILSIDLEKLQDHISHVLEKVLSQDRRSISYEPKWPLSDERELMILLDEFEEDIMDPLEEDGDAFLAENPITKDEIFSFREYLKSYRMPWKGNRL